VHASERTPSGAAVRPPHTGRDERRRRRIGQHRQPGWCVVENHPPCPIRDISDIFNCPNPATWIGHGLAEYSPPVSFTGIHLSAIGNLASSWEYYQWQMTGAKGRQLATVACSMT
jgi:hypothetical protein